MTEKYRAHLRAHGFEWILDLGADARTCEDVLVYADAREDRLLVRPPLILDGLRLLTLIDSRGRAISQSVRLSSYGERIDTIQGEIGGYMLENLGSSKVRRRFRGKTALTSSAMVYFEDNVIRFEDLELDRDDMRRLLRMIATKEVTLERMSTDGLSYRVIGGEYRGLVVIFTIVENRLVPSEIRCLEGRSFSVLAR